MQKTMKISQLYSMGIIDDKTDVIICSYDMSLVVRGNWYQDDIVKFMEQDMKRFECRIWDNTVIIDLPKKDGEE